MHLIRVFNTPGSHGGGNPAPVWLDADDMTPAEMQAHAHASGHESVFVLKPSDAAHRLRMRYFVPKHEMEMCGHATIGALWLLHRRGDWDGAPISIQTLSGTVQGRCLQGMVEISQPRATVQIADDALVERIARCLNIEAAQIVGPVLNASTSRVKTLIRLANPEALHALRVDFASVEALCESLGSTGLYPYALSEGETNTVSARQFPKSSGYPEDPATGIAAAALAWGLRHQHLVGSNEAVVTVRQGEAMGSPSAIFVRLPAQEADAQGCWLRGEAQEMPSAADLRLESLSARDETSRARPAGNYASFSRAGPLLYSSGVVGREKGQVITGQLTGADCVPRGERAAVAAVVAILRAAQDEHGSLARVRKVVALNGYLNASSSFEHHVRVMNAASAAIGHVLQRSPLPARTTVGVSSLPGGGAVEVSMVIRTRLCATASSVTGPSRGRTRLRARCPAAWKPPACCRQLMPWRRRSRGAPAR